MNVTASEPAAMPGPVQIGDTPVQVGRSSVATLRLLHPTVSRSHAVIERQGGEVIVRDLDSRYGTFVNKARVGAKTLAKDDLIRFGTSDSYRFTGDSLIFEPVADGYSLSLNNVTIVKNGLTLVSGASFELPANEFIGILGPSGSGKSTLLSVLASYHLPVSGEVLFDGEKPVKDYLEDYRTCLGNVPQKDIVYSGLTARENLLFSARLRCTADTPDAALDEQVTRALTQVDLLPHADTLFESLSGGQQKRVSVALELLKRPRLLLLDEPTSGLDPAAEASLMETLKVIASQGTTVACTTHQMDNVGLFDRVVVIGCEHVPWQPKPVGRVAYVDDPDSLLSHFGCRSFADAFEKLREGAFTPAGDPSTNANAQLISVETPPSTAAKLSELMEKPLQDGVLRQAKTVAERNWKRMVRDRSLVATMLAQPVVLGVLVAVTQFAPADSKMLGFFACVCSIWMGLNNSARDLVRERRNYVRERLAGLSPDAYLLSKLVMYSVVGFVQTMLLLAVLVLVGSVTVGEGSILREFTSWIRDKGGDAPPASLLSIHLVYIQFCLFACYLSGLGLGLLASTLARSEEAAVAALPLLIMPQILISAVACGCSGGYETARAFKPIVLSLTGDPASSVAGRTLDGVSFLCYSRPASLMLEYQSAEKYRWLWLGDGLHLLILLMLTWVAVYVAFRLNEEKWPKFLGLG
jgi:ABC-type multidrug transport system ATPase subunit